MRAGVCVRRATLAALALLLVLLQAAPAHAGATSIPLGSSWSLLFVDAVYYHNRGVTIFSYDVTAINADLSDFVIGTNGCTSAPVCPLDDVNNCMFDGPTTNPFLMATGYKLRSGLRSGNTARYRLAITGKWSPTAAVQFWLGGAGFASSGTTIGPDCTAPQTAYPGVDSLCYRADVLVECNSPTALLVSSPDDVFTETRFKTVTHKCASDYGLRRRRRCTVDGYTTQFDQIVTVQDTTKPEYEPATLPPAMLQVECSALATVPPGSSWTPVATDNCPGPVNITYAEKCESPHPGSCPDDQYITREWTALDSCGNSNCFTQTVTVVDTTPPTFDHVPPSYTDECVGYVDPATVPYDILNTTDNCDPARKSIVPEIVVIAGGCPNTFQIQRTWMDMDRCMNQVGPVVQLYTVEDRLAPQLTYNSSEVYIVAQCSSPPSPMTVTAYDLCLDLTWAVTPVPSTDTSNQRCIDEKIITYTYTATDRCFHSNSTQQRVKLIDTIRPQFVEASQGNLTVECNAVPAPPKYNATDNCDTYVDVVLNEVPIGLPDQCYNRYTIVRTWTATDNCFNAQPRVEYIFVNDTKVNPFNLSSFPTVRSQQCSVPPTATVSVLPEDPDTPWGLRVCDRSVTLTSSDGPREDQTCPYRYRVRRTHTATDICNNAVSESYDVFSLDDNPPVITNVPSYTSIECGSPYPTLVPPTVTDTCDPKPTLVGTSNAVYTCGGAFRNTTTWTAYDSCSNYAVPQTSVVDVFDTTPPSFTFVPSVRLRDCSDPPLLFNNLSVDVTDTCSTFTVTYYPPAPRDKLLPRCNYFETHKWVAVDACGNNATVSFDVNIVDTHAPNITGVPASPMRVNCTAPPPPRVCAEDDCNNATLKLLYTKLPGACPTSYYVNYTWVARDDCGLQAVSTLEVYVDDREAPQFDLPYPADDRDPVLCLSQVPPSVNLTARDNCGTVYTVVPTEVITYDNNPPCRNRGWVQRVWSVTDGCSSNSITRNYRFNLNQPPAGPTFDTPTYVCSNIPPPPNPTFVDRCGNPVFFDRSTQFTSTILPPVEPLPGVPPTCPSYYRIKYQWLPTDECGNTNNDVTQTVTIVPEDEPFFTYVPANITVPCNDVNASLEFPRAASNCPGNNVTVTRLSDEYPYRPVAPCSQEYHFHRVFLAIDLCGKSRLLVQRVDVDDPFPPNMTQVPAVATAECQNIPLPPQVCAFDTCAHSEVTFTETRNNAVSPQCPANYDLIRIWSATDDCNAPVTQTQTMQVRDRTPPYFTWAPPRTLPASECPCDFEPENPRFTDACDGYATSLYPNGRDTKTGDMRCNYTITRTWVIVDQCGNQNSTTSDMRIFDTKPPHPIDILPPIVRRDQCEFPDVPSVDFVDDCTRLRVVPTARPITITTDPTCPYRKNRTITWVLVDDCNNAANYTQVQVLPYDTLGPRWLDPLPGPFSEPCDGRSTQIDLRAVDGCNLPLTVTKNEGRLDGKCAYNYTRLLTWSAVDSCGKRLFWSQNITVFDNQPPTVDTPTGRTFTDQCTVQPPPQIKMCDSCDANFTMAVSNVTRLSCPGKGTVTWTWVVADTCSNAVTVSATDTYNRVAPPTLGLASNFSQLPPPVTADVECSDTTAINFWPVLVGRDGCGKSYPVDHFSFIENKRCCNNYDIVHVWNFTDNCGQVAEYRQRVPVRDKTRPRLQGVPSSVSVQCGFVPPRANVTATDNCNGVQIEFTESKNQPDPLKCCEYTLNRTWTARDACGLIDGPYSQIITVSDHIPPVIVVPSDTCIECSDPIPALTAGVSAFKAPLALGWCIADERAADPNCYSGAPDGSIVLNGVGFNVVGSPNTLLWYADGRVIISATISSPSGDTFDLQLRLTNPTPVIPSSIPYQPLNPQCYSGSAQPGGWKFLGNLTGTLTGTAGAVAGQVLTVNAETAVGQLGFGANGRNINQGFYITFPFGGAATGTGTLLLQLDQCSLTHLELHELNCKENITINCTEIRQDSTVCTDQYTLLRTCTAYDPSGNNATASWKLCVRDTQPPKILTPTINNQLFPGCYIPEPITLQVIDNCTGNPTQTHTDVVVGNCAFTRTVTRTYLVTDACNNTTPSVHVLRIEDVVGPTITGLPGNIVNENQCVPRPYVVPTLTDTCSAPQNITLNYNNVTTRGPGVAETCRRFRITHSYTATDDCGNPSTASYYEDVYDHTPPTFGNLPNPLVQTNECSAPPFWPVTASDNCEGDVTARIVRSNTTTALCGTDGSRVYTQVRTYSVQDSCGNPDSTSYTVVSQDTTPPSIATLADVTVACDEPYPAVILPTASDTCSGVASVTLESEVEVPDNDNCNKTRRYRRTFKAVDKCGNPNTSTQDVIVTNGRPPTLVGVPAADITAECDNIPNPPCVSVLDSCSYPTKLAYEQRITPGRCKDSYTITRIYTATDACGVPTKQNYSIFVNDTRAPDFQGVAPQSYTTQCDAYIPEVPLPTAVDACAGPVNVLYSNVSVPDPSCPQNRVIYRTWTATDNCGHVTVRTQNVTVQDITPPELHCKGCVFEAPPRTAECSLPEAPTVTAFDTCQGDLTSNVTVTPTVIFPCGANAPRVNITRYNYHVSDCAGHTDDNYFEVQSVDTQGPLLTVPASQTVQCYEPIPVFTAGNATATDTCTNVVSITLQSTPPVYQGCPSNYYVDNTWTATDSCNNPSQSSNRLVVQDNDPPVITCKGDNVRFGEWSVFCYEVPPAPDCCVADRCTTVNMTLNVTKVPTQCSNVYTIYREWSAKDACGNPALGKQQIIHVLDGPGPFFSGLPVNATLNFKCDEVIPPPPTVTAWDFCNNASITVEPIFTTKYPIPGCISTRVINRTWVATNACGKQNVFTQIINVVDNEAPKLGLPVPPTRTFECGTTIPEQLPTPDGRPVTDNCEIVTVRRWNETVSGPCRNQRTITRYWYAQDSCGNNVTRSEIIYVVDTTPPALYTDNVMPPNDTTYECNQYPPFQTKVSVGAGPCSDLVCGNLDVSRSNLTCGYDVVATWTVADDCGNSASETRIFHIRPLEPPKLLNVPLNATFNIGKNCIIPNFAPSPPVDATGVCEKPLLFSNVTTVFPRPGCINRTVTTTWTAQDCAHSVNRSQIVQIRDVASPSVTLQTNSPFDPAQPYYYYFDRCDLPSVNVTQQLISCSDCSNCSLRLDSSDFTVSTSASCKDRNYYKKAVYSYVAEDGCGLQTSFLQTIFVKPNLKPIPSLKNIDCFFVATNTNPPGGKRFKPEDLFAATSVCNLKLIFTVTSCSSDRDAIVTPTPAFTDDCFLSNFTLFVSGNTKGFPNRTYTITGQVEDECGNKEVVTATVVAGDATSGCAMLAVNCTSICPCEYANALCAAVPSGASVSYSLSEVNSNTVLTYSVNAPSAQAIALNLDLSKIVVLSVTPDVKVEFGATDASAIAGITVKLLSNPTDVVITLQGPVSKYMVFSTTYQLFFSGSCDFGTTLGVKLAPTDLATGLVAVAGIFSQPVNWTPRFGLGGVVVVGLVNGLPVATTMTDERGHFPLFTVSGGSVRLRIEPAGFFRDKMQRYFSQSDGTSVLSSVDFTSNPPVTIVLNDDQVLLAPDYVRDTPDDSFRGSVISRYQWGHLLSVAASGFTGSLGEFTAVQLGRFVTDVNELLDPLAPVSASSLAAVLLNSASDQLTANTYTAALNHVSGRGVLGTMRDLQPALIRNAAFVLYDPVPSEAAANVALLDRILTAH